MTLRTLILRSLRFHWRAHLGVLLGAAIGSAALIGALVVGDSVRGSLRAMALERLGYIQFILPGLDRTFTDTLGERMPRDLMDSWSESSDGECMDTYVWFGGGPGAVLLLPGTASRPAGEARANQVSVLGIRQLPLDERHNHYYDFWNYAGWSDAPPIAPGEVWVNEALARQLAVAVGDTVVLRFRKPSALSADTPVSPRGDSSIAVRLRVGKILQVGRLANFSLRASAVPPLNAFLNLRTLQMALDLPGRANLLVAGGVMEERIGGALDSAKKQLREQGGQGGKQLAELLPSRPAKRRPAAQAQADFQEELAYHATLGDYEASLRITPGSKQVELISRRIFLDPPLVRAVPGPGTNSNARVLRDRHVDLDPDDPLPPTTDTHPLLTYLVNLLRAGTNAVPYSMVTAAGAPWTPTGMRDDEILVNQWLADDLRVKPGDEMELVYYLPESGAKLLEATNRFRVRGVVPMEMPWADRTLMPEFPGIEKAESTADWDTAFPLVHKIRPQDEAYWKQRRGTPKAFVTLAAGQMMWGNRFGNLTAIRFPVPTNAVGDELARLTSASANADGKVGESEPPYVGAYRQALERKILATLKPEEVGLRWEPVREQALKAAEQSQDFGGLFIGFSFFLIAAALLLMALLFQFGVEQRSMEVGTLLALGFPPKQVRRLWLGEGAALAFLGGVIGAAGGVAYAWAMLRGLSTVWSDAVGGTTLGFHVSASTLLIGVLAGTLVAVVVIWLTLRKLGRQPARVLLSGNTESASQPSRLPLPGLLKSGDKSPHSRGGWLALGGAAALVGWAVARGDTANAGAFFGAGALVLIAGLSFLSSALKRSVRVSPSSILHPPSSSVLALRGLARRRSRSVATAALLACGSFLIASIGVFRLDADRDATERSSGTGGFALIGESTLAVFQDLNTPAGRDALGLNEGDLKGVNVVPFRVRAGDEASCLNLNRAQQPRLLGVNPLALASRFAFSKGTGWQRLSDEETNRSPSSIQPPPSSPPEIPAIGDAASIQWAMGKKVGDTIQYVDERGQPFKVRIIGAVANSILQGSLVIDEAAFVKRFPSASGHQFFLLDAPSNRLAEVSAVLSRGLRDYGLELTPAARRLAQFNAVQNTYLGTFQILGGLGLLLGSVGLGIIVLRNVLERRGELAVLLALGWRRGQVRRLVLIEHAALLAAGLAIGVLAAAVAVLPGLLAPGGSLPWRSLAPTLIGVLLVGFAAAWLGTRWALRGNLLAALRNE